MSVEPRRPGSDVIVPNNGKRFGGESVIERERRREQAKQQMQASLDRQQQGDSAS